MNLFQERIIEDIEAGIEANRAQAASLTPLRTDEAREQMHALNQAWYELEAEKHYMTGIDPAPYRMK